MSDMVAEDLVSHGAVVMGRRDVQRRSRTVGGRPERERLVGRGASVPQARLRPDAPRAEPLRLGETTFTFVTDGVESAVEQARAAAGDKDVLVAGGAEAAQQVLSAGLLDEAQIHLVPVLLGGGTRLFDGIGEAKLERTRVLDSPAATHLHYRVVK